MSLPPLPDPDLGSIGVNGVVYQLGRSDEQMRAYAAQAVAERDDELAEWRKLRDPVVLHANLLRGIPAQLDSATFLHLAGECAIAKAVAAAAEAEREACARICDTTPPYPFRPSIEAAHAIRARSTASASRTKGDKPALESAPDASSAPCR